MNRLFRLIGLLGILLILLLSYLYYIWFVKEATNLPKGQTAELYLKTGSTSIDLFKLLRERNLIQNMDDFEVFTVFKRMKNVQSGHYVLTSGMNCNQVVNTFIKGLQTPVKVVITPSRLPEDLAHKLSLALELDSITILTALKSDSIAHEYGFSNYDFYTMFLCDTYEMYWNSSMEKLLARMKSEYDNFWDQERKAKAQEINLNLKEVITLASIVYAEQSQFSDERARIAGLYLNRLEIGMALQSDPTLIYGIGDFNLKRVLNKDKQIDTPYNTYMYSGLPIGPIYSPNKSSIDAVLNPEDNNYLYMCAKEDFSGYHSFATNLRQHNNNARRYQRALDRTHIYR